MRIKQIQTSLFAKILLICSFVAGYFVTLSWLNANLRQSPQLPDCNKNGRPIADSSAWSIVSSDLPARILWQKSEQRPRPNGIVRSPNSGIAVSIGQVAYWRERQDSSSYCDEQPQTVAFDANTGREKWRFTPEIPLLRHIVPISGGFGLVLDTTIISLDDTGKVRWQNSSFPTRSTETMFQVQDTLYVPSYTQVYQLSVETGKTTQVIPIRHLIAYFDKYVLVASEDGSELHILDLTKNGITVLSVSDLGPILASLQNNLAFLTPNTARDGDILLFFSGVYSRGSQLIEAYSVTSGHRLWTSREAFYGLPIAVNGRLILHNRDGLKMLSIQTGNQIGKVNLLRRPDEKFGTGMPFDVWLAGEGNTIFVSYRDTWEVLAIKVGS